VMGMGGRSHSGDETRQDKTRYERVAPGSTPEITAEMRAGLPIQHSGCASHRQGTIYLSAPAPAPTEQTEAEERQGLFPSSDRWVDEGRAKIAGLHGTEWKGEVSIEDRG